MHPIFSTACSRLASARPGLREQCHDGRSRSATLKSHTQHTRRCHKQRLPPKKDLPAFGDPPHTFAGKHEGRESCSEAEVSALPQLLLSQIKAAARTSRSLRPGSPCELTDLSLQSSLRAVPKRCRRHPEHKSQGHRWDPPSARSETSALRPPPPRDEESQQPGVPRGTAASLGPTKPCDSKGSACQRETALLRDCEDVSPSSRANPSRTRERMRRWRGPSELGSEQGAGLEMATGLRGD